MLAKSAKSAFFMNATGLAAEGDAAAAVTPVALCCHC